MKLHADIAKCSGAHFPQAASKDHGFGIVDLILGQFAARIYQLSI
ncbi:MAG: hypothetical protein ABI164_10040 [Acidobacteriaceae bacterium]